MSTSVNTAGLSSEEASRRLARDGPNRIELTAQTPAWRRLAGEMVHFFALLLWAASGFAYVAGMPQLSIAIVIVVLLNGVFAFAQEERATHAAQRLRDMLPRLVVVIRDGAVQQISADALVRGDVVTMTEGDRICADATLTSTASLAVDTSALTGESVAEHPGPGEMVFAGCFVVEGEGTAVVTATAEHTRLAGIAHLTQTQVQVPTPLRRELGRVSKVIALVSLSVGAAFFGIAAMMGMPSGAGFLFAVGVTVAVVPEGLLPTVTLSLAVGAQRMARHHALVRHLEAVETLGSTTFICTDKTGTLTQNEMSAVEVWTPDGSARITGVGYEPTATIEFDRQASELAVRTLAAAAARCSTGFAIQVDGHWRPQGDPMEAALDVLNRRVTAGGMLFDGPELVRFPFDARRRRMSIVLSHGAGQEVLVKGAPDSVLPLCRESAGATDAVTRLTSRGLRVLAVACRRLTATVPTADQAECGLTLLGLVALQDPPRPEVRGVLQSCRTRGIRVAMITGDDANTAAAIATEVGLAGDDRIVLLGADLTEDLSELGAQVDRDGVVVARVTPEVKLRIAKALRLRGHIVAMTGDGVNDAPALREAAIGVAMGKGGTDVAREAADMVLLDDNFATIVSAIEQGHATFTNIRRFLTYHLADNVAELTPFVVWALSAGTIPLAINVLQVLALDIGTDVFPALALGAEPPDHRPSQSRPVRGHLLDRGLLVRAFAVLGATEAVVAMTAFFATFYSAGWRPGHEIPTGTTLLAASGAAFSAIVLGQAANAFACRSARAPAWRLDPRTNRLLVVAVLAEVTVLVLLLTIAPAAHLLGHALPTVTGTVVALMAVPAVLCADTVHKFFIRSRDRRPPG